MRRFPQSVLLAASLLAGCTVGPGYHPGDPSVPAAYAGPQPLSATAGVDRARWWTAFGDAELTTLVDRALRDNPGVALAASRVRQARLQEIIARADGKPELNANGEFTYLHFSKNAGISQIARAFGGGAGGAAGGGDASGGSATGGSGGGIALPGSGIKTYALGFDASWELDLFGGARRGVEAARARAEAAVWNARDAQVMIAAEVAQAYWALRLDQTQLGVIGEELVRQRRSLGIAENQARVGLVPNADLTQQRAAITATEARLEPIRADVDVRAHALAILLGQPPAALSAELATPLGILAPVPVIPAGLPSELLRRRPDVRVAERQLAAATADIGVAVADLYPRFSLTGMEQLISSALRTLFSGDSLQLMGTAAGQFPIIDWGRRRATVKLREEDREQAYVQYQAAVLQALRDVEDPLVQIEAERRRNLTLQRAINDALATARAREAQYRTGFVAQNTLLDAQTQVLSAREQLASSDAQLRQLTVALVKALGGGWSEDLGNGPDSHSSPVR